MKERSLGELAKGLREGDEEILREWYQDYVKIIESVAYGILRDHGLAEDVCGQLLYALIAGRIKTDAERGKVYLMVATKNYSLNLRKRKKREVGYDDVKSESAFGYSPNFDQLCFFDSLKILSEEEQAVVIKHCFCKYTLREIADIDDIDYEHVKRLFRNARGKLKGGLNYE